MSSTSENRDGVPEFVCVCALVCLQCNGVFLCVLAFFPCVYVHHVSVMQLHSVHVYLSSSLDARVCGFVSVQLFFRKYSETYNQKARLDSDLS